MKKITTLATVSLACLAITSVAFGQSSAARTAAQRAKPKPTVEAPRGSMNAGQATTGANAEARAGIGASSGSQGAANSILDAQVTASLVEKTGGSCNIGDGITTLSRQQQAVVQQAFIMGIAGGQGCLSKFDKETSATAVRMYENAITAAKNEGVRHTSEANINQKAQIVNGKTLALHNALALEGSELQNQEATDRYEGTCANGCELGSGALCDSNVINKSRAL